MKWSSAILTASCGLVAAHGDLPIPGFVGARKFLSELKARHEGPVLPRAAAQHAEHAHVETRGDHEKRQNIDGKCGPDDGSCAPGYCCSAAGWCGNSEEYCEAPDCQMNYGPACDANDRPDGKDTSGVPRPVLGKVIVSGGGIYDCQTPGEIAITFDDGPYIYTNDLLDKFASYGAKATFFITGNNLGKGKINDPSTPYPDIIRRMHTDGHQIASHTWSHQNASQLTNHQFTNQIVWNEIAFNDILGFFPTYMRPPYSICEKTCQDILRVLGYHITYFDLDTEGYLMDDPKLIQTSKDIWDEAIEKSNPAKSNFLNIEHDIHYQSVYNLTDYFLSSLFKHGYKSVTVGQCLGDPAENWYRAGPGGSKPSGSSSPTPTPTPTPTRTSTPTSTTISVEPTGTQPAEGPYVSEDGLCGADSNQSCFGSTFGECCSAAGKCAISTLACLSILGCQENFGQCI